MAQNDDPKRKALKQTIRRPPAQAATPVEPPGRAPAREPIPGAAPTPESKAAEVAGIREQFAGMPQAIEPPGGVPAAPYARAEEARTPLQAPVGAPAAQPPGIRRGVGALPERLATQPGYQEAAELRRTGPAGIRAGTVGKYGAGETPFSQEQWERAKTVGQYERGVPQLTPREMEARGVGPGARSREATGVALGAPMPIGGGTAPTGIREYKPEEFVTHSGGDRILNVAAVKAAGFNIDQVLAQQRQATERAGQQQRAGTARATGLRAEKKLASEERRARLTGIRATGKEAAAERRFGETRTFETQKFMSGRTDQRVEEMATELQDGKPVVIPGRAQEVRGFIGRSGGARSEGELEHLTSMFTVGKAFQRAQGQAANPLQSLRDAPIIGGLIRGLDERGTPQINEAQVRSALKSYNPKAGTYKIGKETVSEADLGLESGMVASMLRGLLEQ